MKNRWKRVAFLMWVIQLQISCLPRIVPYRTEETFQSASGKPDYQSLDYWAAHPQKWDPSDSVQAGLGSVQRKRDVDVFFLHPTTYTDGSPDEGIPTNARIDDPFINKKTDFTSILYQASVFNGDCDVYAPRYRQAHIAMYYEKDTLKARRSFQMAYEDVKAAFEVFLKMNRGRPFIIGSHSQGTSHAIRLIAEMLDSSEVRKNLVAAYLIGIAVPKRSFRHLDICRDTSETGCFVSWRTFQDGYRNSSISLTDNTTGIVNPVHWKSDSSRTGRREHLGAILYNYQKIYRGTHEAQIQGNALFISKPKFSGSFMMRMKNYHAGDINLFYLDIRKDVHRRISHYMMDE